ncbi:MAG TPA: hypothetical protein VI750_15105, partial [Pyrinomonadaceae bacterium]|nr:hypothetical protein [Pyrinomonadaceae bacterium]
YAVFGEKILAVRMVESVLGAGLAVLVGVFAGENRRLCAIDHTRLIYYVFQEAVGLTCFK